MLVDNETCTIVKGWNGSERWDIWWSRRTVRRGSLCGAANWGLQEAAPELWGGEQRRKGSRGPQARPPVYFLMSPLVLDCSRLSVPGLNRSGWKVFSLLFEAKNTSCTASLFCHLNGQEAVISVLYLCLLANLRVKLRSQTTWVQVPALPLLLCDLGQVTYPLYALFPQLQN